jgi:hypothetical protein
MNDKALRIRSRRFSFLSSCALLRVALAEYTKLMRLNAMHGKPIPIAIFSTSLSDILKT